MEAVAVSPSPISTSTATPRPSRPPALLPRRSWPAAPPPTTSASSLVTARARRRLALPLPGPPGASSMAPSRRAAAASSSPPAAAAGTFNAVARASGPCFVGENDLLIVGPGVLGRIVAGKWKQEHPGCQVFGQTLTTDHHDELIELGIKPSLIVSNTDQFPSVIFCAPPSRSADYPADVRLAVSYWSGEGSFLFTSSTAAYDCSDNGLCNEDSPVVPLGRDSRTDVMLKAENVALEAGGCVLRLAGLYKFDRGAHVYWLTKGIVEARPDHVVNLIHYEDAASLSVAILKKQLQGRIFLGCDGHPLSRQQIMDYTNRSGKFDKVFDKFTGTSGPLGKRLNNSKTCAELGWEPKYESFPFFLELTE